MSAIAPTADAPFPVQSNGDASVDECARKAGVLGRITRMKLAHRPPGRWREESEWSRHGWAQGRFDEYRAQSFAQLGSNKPGSDAYESGAAFASRAAAEGISAQRLARVPRLSGRELTPAQFHAHIESARLPCVIDGLAEEWPMRSWSIEALGSDENQYRSVKFKVDEQASAREEREAQGEEEEEKGAHTNDAAIVADKDDVDVACESVIDALQADSLKLPLRDFLTYLHHNTDDVPLYVFDAVFDCDPVGRDILDEFRVPPHFSPDLFSYLGEVRRPPYRWLLIGPERSGSALHLDPLATSAWNTNLDGVKRWVLFPPGTDRATVKGRHLVPDGFARDGNCDDMTEEEVADAMEAVHYFTYGLEKLRSDAGTAAVPAPAAGIPAAPAAPPMPSHGMIEFLQWPGETVFVPHGWLHAVLNLTPTVAVTQNFVSPRNFLASWSEARASRPHLAERWREQIRRHEPDLFAAAAEADARAPLDRIPVPTFSPSRRPSCDHVEAAADPDSWYWNPSSSDDDEEEEDESYQ